MHYRLYLVTVLMTEMHNRRTVWFSKRTDVWCMFSCSVFFQNSHLIRCNQSSISQVYDGIHKSWEDIITWEEQWPKPKTNYHGSLYVIEDCV